MSHRYSMMVFLVGSILGSSAAIANPDTIRKGHDVYQKRCLHCHGDKADGQGHLINILKIAPANLTTIAKSGGCVSDKVLKAVNGRHEVADGKAKMPVLKEALTVESVYNLSEYLKSIQQ